MKEKIIRVVEEAESRLGKLVIVETQYEFGTHYVLLENGKPGFHSTDLERVRNYLKTWL